MHICTVSNFIVACKCWLPVTDDVQVNVSLRDYPELIQEGEGFGFFKTVLIFKSLFI